MYRPVKAKDCAAAGPFVRSAHRVVGAADAPV